MLAQNPFEKAGRQFVMLLVRLFCRDGDRACPQLGDMPHESRLALFAIELFEWRESSRQAMADSNADQGIWDDALGE